MKQRLCPGCLLPRYECVCPTDEIVTDPLKLRLKRLGIKDPRLLIASCIAHGTGRLRRAVLDHPSWYSQR